MTGGLFFDEHMGGEAMADHCEVSGARLSRPGRGESLTMDEAAAFKAGAEAMREAAIDAAWRTALKRANQTLPGIEEARGASDMRCVIAAAIRALPPPEPPASLSADGLCGRGA